MKQVFISTFYLIIFTFYLKNDCQFLLFCLIILISVFCFSYDSMSISTFISSFQLEIYQSIFFFYGGNGLPRRTFRQEGKFCRRPLAVWLTVFTKETSAVDSRVTGHFMASFCRRSKRTVTRTVRVHRRKSVIRFLTSVEDDRVVRSAWTVLQRSSVFL